MPSSDKTDSRGRKRKTQTARLLTTEENVKQVKCKKILVEEKNQKTHSAKKVKKGKRELATKIRSKSPAENDNCGFCSLNYYSPKSIAKGSWICCQRCNVWFHEV